MGHPIAESSILIPVLEQNLSLRRDEPSGLSKASAEQERRAEAVGEEQEADVWREIGGAFGEQRMDVGQSVPGPWRRVQDVPHNLEVASFFHQLRDERIDDCSAIRNCVDHNRDGLLRATGGDSFKSIDALHGVGLESIAVKLAVLRKLRGDRGGVVTYGIVQAPVPLQRRQVHESAADQENERLLLVLDRIVPFGG